MLDTPTELGAQLGVPAEVLADLKERGVELTPDFVDHLKAIGCLSLLTAKSADEVVRLEVTTREPMPTHAEYARSLELAAILEAGNELSEGDQREWNALQSGFDFAGESLTPEQVDDLELRQAAVEILKDRELVAWDAALRRARPRNRRDAREWGRRSVADVLFQRVRPQRQPRRRTEGGPRRSTRRRSTGQSRDGPDKPDDEPPDLGCPLPARVPAAAAPGHSARTRRWTHDARAGRSRPHPRATLSVDPRRRPGIGLLVGGGRDRHPRTREGPLLWVVELGDLFGVAS